MRSLFTRREALLGGALALAPRLRALGRGDRLDAPAVEFADPLTGRKMFRLTDPRALFHLPHRSKGCLSRGNDILLMAGEIGGSRQLFEYDLKRERLTQVSDGPGLVPQAAALDERGRTLVYIQAGRVTDGGGGTLAEIEAGWEAAGVLALSAEGERVAWIERRADGGDHRVQSVAAGGPQRTLITTPKTLVSVGYGRGFDLLVGDSVGRISVLPASGGEPRTVREPVGGEQILDPQWSEDGRIWFVHYPEPGYRGATVRVIDAAGEERTVSRCSGFGWFQVNPDASAIIGASRRPSAPSILVLFPRLQREITLCEHASSKKAYPIAGSEAMDPDCALPAPVVSPDSQWLYFTTDREGLPAVYKMKLEDLVSET